MRQIFSKTCHNKRAPSRWSSLLTFKAAPQPCLYTYPVYRTHLCQCSQKVARNEAEAIKIVTTNEPPLCGQRHLPSCLPISAIVPKKWGEMWQICSEKYHNERVPSRWPSPLTFKTAPQPCLYAYPDGSSLSVFPKSSVK